MTNKMVVHFLYLVSLLFVPTFNCESFTFDNLVPVIYVIFGPTPMFLKLNIELAARNNPVVLISDTQNEFTNSSNLKKHVKYEQLTPYFKSADGFKAYYKHLSKDKSVSRYTHELHCFQRWFILQDYMKINNISHAFFGDGDNAVFTNITTAYELRRDCDAVINIEYQPTIYHWAGAGEASLWTYNAISNFCTFTTRMYQKHLPTLETKLSSGSSVVDMSLLWLWWIHQMKLHDPMHNVGTNSIKNNIGDGQYITEFKALYTNNTDNISIEEYNAWYTGRPYYPFNCNLLPRGKLHLCRDLYQKHDVAYRYALTLTMPQMNTKLKLCNGLDIVNRTIFDHMHAWQSGNGFTFNLPLVSTTDRRQLIVNNSGVIITDSIQNIHSNMHSMLNNNSFVNTTTSTDSISHSSSSMHNNGNNLYTGRGIPTTYMIAHALGGKPEIMHYETIHNISQQQPVMFNNIHYQGATAKQYMYYDICRILLLTGDGIIANSEVAKRCEEERLSHNNDLTKCQNHDPPYWIRNSKPICA